MNKEAIKAAISFTVGLFVYKFFQLPHGDWILVTMAIIYLAGSITGLKMEKINKRILGSVVGVILGLFILEGFGYYDYRVLYLVPLTWFLMFYLYYLTNNYTYMAIFVSVMLLFCIAILAPQNFDWNLYNTAFSRIYCTIIGAVIMLLTESLIFYEDSRADKKIYPEIYNILKILSELIDEIIRLFQDNEATSEELREKYYILYNEVFKLELLIRAVKFEVTFHSKKGKHYNKMCRELYSSLKFLRECMFITGHRNGEKTQNVKLLNDIRAYFKSHFNSDAVLAESLKSVMRDNKKFAKAPVGETTEDYFIHSLIRISEYLIQVKRRNRHIASL